MNEINHITSIDSAISILETKSIFGANWKEPRSHEAYPHFNNSAYQEFGNCIEKNEIRLYFYSDLPVIKCGAFPPNNSDEFDGGFLYCQFMNVFSDNITENHRFWQSIISPNTENPIVFCGYEINKKIVCSFWRRRLFHYHQKVKTPVRVVWHPGSPMARRVRQPALVRPRLLHRFFRAAEIIADFR